MEQCSVENGDGGRRLINKPVLPSLEPTLTVMEPMEQGSDKNGDGGRRLINKPVLPSPELTLTVTEIVRKDVGDIEEVKEESEMEGLAKEDSRIREMVVSHKLEDGEEIPPQNQDQSEEILMGNVDTSVLVPENTNAVGEINMTGVATVESVDRNSELLSETETAGSSEESEPESKRGRYKRCIVCAKECLKKIKRCHQCHGGCYCSRKCREDHKKDHEEICNNIQELEKIEASKRVLSAFSVREPNQVKVKLKNGLVKLVGERPLLHCALGESECTALWDTGAMVSMVSTSWLEKNRPDTKVMTIEEFLEGDSLHLCAANNTNVDVDGVVVLKFGIGKSLDVSVPFLVSRNELDAPIIGYNVIKHVVQQDVEELPQLLKDSVPSLASLSKAEAVIALIKTDLNEEEEVKVPKRTTIPANS